MGQGDIKMMMMAGAFLGVTNTFLTILIGTLLGSLIGLSIITLLYMRGWKRRVAERASRRGIGTISALRYALASKYQLPFGTFLGAGALLVVFFGTSALEWYFSVSAGR
jgi:leader peptidase (prepilin peptidase)/N-methyltransferase